MSSPSANLIPNTSRSQRIDKVSAIGLTPPRSPFLVRPAEWPKTAFEIRPTVAVKWKRNASARNESAVIKVRRVFPVVLALVPRLLEDPRRPSCVGTRPRAPTLPHLACPISEERARVRRCGRVHVVSRDVWRTPKDRADLVAQSLAVPGTGLLGKATPASVVLIGRGSGQERIAVAGLLTVPQ